MSNSAIAPIIQQKYAEHSALIQQLASADYAPHAYTSNQKRLEHIKKEIEKRKQHLVKLAAKTKSEWDDVKGLEKSTSKKIFTRLTKGESGLQKKKDKEQQEYLDAFEAEHKEKLAIKALEEELESVESTTTHLKDASKTREDIQKRLDQLYQELFEGLTADYPEEDEAEKKVQAFQADYAAAQERLNKESQVNGYLSKAHKSLSKVMERMTKAEEICLKELLSRNRAYEIYELKDLQSAKKYSLEVDMFIGEARKLEKKVHDLGKIGVPFHDGIAVSNPELSQPGDVQIFRTVLEATKGCACFAGKLEMEIIESRERMQVASKAAINHATNLAIQRSQLERIRRQIIEDVHQGRMPTNTAWVPFAGTGMPSPQSTTSTSSFPSGGFRSGAGGIAMSSPTDEGKTVRFPDGPGYNPPALKPEQTVPGFRGAAEANVVASIAAMTFPNATPWSLNPEAAAMLLNSTMDGADDLKAADVKMPQGPDGPSMPMSPNDAIPDTPSFPEPPADGVYNWPESDDDESVLFEGVAKIFTSLGKARWETSAAGPIRLLLDNKTATLRLIWTDKNRPSERSRHDLKDDLRPLPSIGKEGTFYWNILANEEVALRFVDADAAQDFQAAASRAHATLQRSLSPSPELSGPSMPQLPSDQSAPAEPQVAVSEPSTFTGFPKSPGDNPAPPRISTVPSMPRDPSMAPLPEMPRPTVPVPERREGLNSTTGGKLEL